MLTLIKRQLLQIDGKIFHDHGLNLAIVKYPYYPEQSTDQCILYQNPNGPLPQPLAITTLFFASMSLTILDTSYKWDPGDFVQYKVSVMQDKL